MSGTAITLHALLLVVCGKGREEHAALGLHTLAQRQLLCFVHNLLRHGHCKRRRRRR